MASPDKAKADSFELPPRSFSMTANAFSKAFFDCFFFTFSDAIKLTGL